MNRARNSRCTGQIWTPQNGAHRKPFPAATPSLKLATRPHSSMRSELLVTHEKLGQLPLLTVYIVPMKGEK
jgi:hypothetical protein